MTYIKKVSWCTSRCTLEPQSLGGRRFKVFGDSNSDCCSVSKKKCKQSSSNGFDLFKLFKQGHVLGLHLCLGNTLPLNLSIILLPDHHNNTLYISELTGIAPLIEDDAQLNSSLATEHTVSQTNPHTLSWLDYFEAKLKLSRRACSETNPSMKIQSLIVTQPSWPNQKRINRTVFCTSYNLIPNRILLLQDLCTCKSPLILPAINSFNKLKLIKYHPLSMNCNYSKLKVIKASRVPATIRQHQLTSGDIETNPGPTPCPARAPDGLLDEQHGSRRTNLQGHSDHATIWVKTYNVRGLSDEKKLRHLPSWCRKSCNKITDSFFMLQETFISNQGKLPYIWRGNFHLTSGTGHGLGCFTLLSSHINIVYALDIGQSAHILVCQNSLDSKASYIVTNIYAPCPNSQEKLFFLRKSLEK